MTVGSASIVKDPLPAAAAVAFLGGMTKMLEGMQVLTAKKLGMDT
jgi:hypothetical protein